MSKFHSILRPNDMTRGSSHYLALRKFHMTHEQHSIHCAHEADLATFRQAIINIELTLERMSGILEAQAKLEERTAHIEKTVNDLNNRVRKAEETINHSTGSSKWADKLLWAIVSSIITGGLIFVKLQIL